jgi:hypothetical protein
MGGKAFKDQSRRILKTEIELTLYWFSSRWFDTKLQPPYLVPWLLGSANKNVDSGDLDLNISESEFAIDDVYDRMVEILGKDQVKLHKGLNQIYTLVPIGGRRSNGFVQIDLMFGNSAWQKFSYHSPKYDSETWYSFSKLKLDQSSYKGLYRTELLKALVAFCSDWVLEDQGELIARVGPTFLHDKGAVWRYRYRPLKKNSTTERVKAFREVSEEEFMQIFPSAFPASHRVISEPQKLIDFLFEQDEHQHLRPDNFQTVEETLYWIKRKFKKDQVDTILKIYVERLNNLKVEIPVKLDSRFKRIS